MVTSGTTTAPIDRILTRLEGVLRQGSGWKARCPAHDDRNPSLSISVAADGKPLVYCHAGCNPTAVLAAIGLSWTAVFSAESERVDPTAVHAARHVRSRVIAAYAYHGPDGAEHFRVVRVEPKGFRPQHCVQGLGYAPGYGDRDLVPYRLSAILSATASAAIFVVEGEKAVDRLHAAGVIATCTPGGAGYATTAWPKVAHHLSGRCVVIVPDNDAAGRRYAQAAAAALVAHAAEVRILDLPGRPAKGGADDWLEAGHTADGLVAAAAAAPRLESGAAFMDVAVATDPSEVVDRSPIGMIRAALLTTDELAALPSPEPVVEGWIDRETTVVIVGKSGACKSLAAQALAWAIASGREWFGLRVRQGPVLYVAAEGTASIVDREAAWRDHAGFTAPMPVHWLTMPVNLRMTEWVDALITVAEEIQPAAVVVDTLARSMAGGNENDAQDMTVVVDATDRLRRATGACVVIIHHAGWEGTRQRGSSVLRAAVDTEITVARDGRMVTLKATKQRCREDGQAIELQQHGALLVQADFTPLSERPLSQGEFTALRTLVGVPLSFTDWRACSGLPERTLTRYRGSLLMRGLVRQTPEARYELSEKGIAHVS